MTKLRTRRFQRYELLRRSGFLRFEAYHLSKVHFSVPYMKPLIREREREYKKAYQEKWAAKKWVQTIRDRYIANEWFDVKGRPSAWAYLREYEHDYRAKYPDYDSPWQHKQKKRRDYVATIEKELGKLPKPVHISDATLARDKAIKNEAREHFRYIRGKNEG